MNEEELLIKIGLDEKEAELYLALLDMGPSSIAQIVKKAGMHRPTVYKVLPLLEEKGLVSQVVKKKRRLFVSESPEKLKGLLETTSRGLDALLPELSNLYHPTSKRPVIKYFEGKKGIQNVFYDFVTTLKNGESYYRYSAAKPLKNSDSYLPKGYHQLTKDKHLLGYVISNEKIAKAQKESPGKNWRIVSSEREMFDHDITQMIYGNKVAFIDYNSETGLIIENTTFAKFQKSIFKLFWEKLSSREEY